MKPSLITAFLAFATSTLAIAIPLPTSAISTASPSSILRSPHPKQTDDNDRPGKSAHECNEILDECKKGARTERFCQEYTCYKTKGACYSGHCDTYRRARRALAGGLRHDEQGINDLTTAAPTPTTFATETSSASSASKAGDSDVDEGYAPRPEDLDDDCRRTEDLLKQFKWNDDTPRPEDLDDDCRRTNDLLKQFKWNDEEVYTPRAEDLDEDCKRTEDLLKQFKWNDDTPRPEDLDEDCRRTNDLLKQFKWIDLEEKDRNQRETSTAMNLV